MAKFSRKKKKYDKEFNDKKEVVSYQPKYDYNQVDIENIDKNVLIKLEEKITLEGKKIGKITYEIGEALEEARKVFKKYSTEENDPSSFVSWYLSLGLNKDQAYIFRGRYKLGLDYPDNLETILSLSNRAVKETINKNTPVEVIEKVTLGELKTGKDIIEERKKVIEKSSTLEIQDDKIINNDILEAEIVETVEEKKVKLKNEIDYILKDIKERERNLKKLKEKKDQLLEELDKI